jgi:hypothetical protein
MTREKAIDPVMDAQQGAAEGPGAGGAPGAGAGIQGAKTARWPRLAAMFASGGARRGETPRGGPTSGAPFLLPIDLP